jgi:hypothetical protein
MNGATAQADIYGIFGAQGLDLGERWTTPATGSPTYLAMKLWRNYDGSDSGFGNTSVSASVGNPDQTDAFAAIRSSDGALTVAVINKNLYDPSNPSATTPVTVNLSNFVGAGTAQVWQLAAINPADQTHAAISHLSDINFSGNSFTANVPMESVTIFVVKPATVPLAPADVAAVAGNGQVNLTWNASSGATSYNIYRATTSGAEVLVASGVKGTSFIDTNVSNGTTYYYKVAAVNGAGVSSKSSEVSATPTSSILTQGVFFTDGANQLWEYDADTGTFIDTGAFASVFSAGVDANGKAECWFLDGNNELWRYDNGSFLQTGAFAQHIAAGKGFVAFSDGTNALYTFTDATKSAVATGGFASRFTAGFDVQGNNQIDFADGSNRLWVYDAKTQAFTNTGGYTAHFVAGQDKAGNNEIWFTDGSNRIYRYDGGQFHQTSAFALQISGTAGGLVSFTDGNNQIWTLSELGAATNTGGYALVISSNPGTTDLFFTDGMNQVWAYNTATGLFTRTGGYALRFSAF